MIRKLLLGAVFAFVIILSSYIVTAPIWYGSGDNTGLVGHWKCEGNFLDSSGNSNHGTQSGGVTITDGIKGRGCKFDGVDAEILTNKNWTQILGSDILNISIAFWAKPNNVTGNHGFFGTYTDSVTRGIMIYSSGTSMIARINGNGTPSFQASATTSVSIDETAFWTMVFNRTGNVTIYKNGAQVGTADISSANGSIIAASQFVRIGNIQYLAYSEGIIDEVRIYNRTLSATEISELYNTTRSYTLKFKSTPTKGISNETPAPTASDETGLVGYWKMDDLTNGNTTDSSGQGNDGVISEATSTNSGRWNGAYSFDGINDYVNLSNNLNLINNFSISAWFNQYSLGGNNYNRIIENYWSDGYYLGGFGSSGSFGFCADAAAVANCTTTTGISLNNWHHIMGIKENNIIYLYIDGTLRSSKTGVNNLAGTTLPTYIGRQWASENNWWNGTIDEVRIYNRSLSASEVQELYLSKGLVGHWKMDADQKNTTSTFDSSGYYNHGLISGATLTNEGRFKEGYKFDGTNDKITSSTILTNVTNFTLSAWIYPMETGSDVDGMAIMAKSSGGFTRAFWLNYAHTADSVTLYMSNSTVNLICAVNSGANTTPARKWSLITATFNTTGCHIFVNGAYNNSDNTVAGLVDNPSGWSNNLVIGYETGTRYFNGSIDEVRVYNRALSSDEIGQLYNGTKSNKIVFKSMPSQGGLSNETPAPTITNEAGLVGYWKMDGDDGSNSTKAMDSSGQGLTGNVTGLAAQTNEGRFKEGYLLDGGNSYIKVGTTEILRPIGNLTVSAWINAKVTGGSYDMILGNTNGNGLCYGYGMYLDTNNAHFWVNGYGSCAPPTPPAGRVSTAYTYTNSWHHLVGTYDNLTVRLYVDGVQKTTLAHNYSINYSGATSGFGIGATSFGTSIYMLNGTVDEVRIYNRTLSSSEVQELYLSKGLVGHWKMDADQRNTTDTFDSSGYYNHGKITGAVLTGEGRFKDGYRFDGNDDYINMGTGTSLNTNQTTISAWVKPAASPQSGYDRIVEKIYMNSYYLGFDTTGTKFKGIFANITSPYGSLDSTTTIQPNQWYHVAITHDGTNDYLYVNGIQEATQANSAVLSNSTMPVYISKYTLSGGYIFNGTIDEVRIYNRALTASEIAGLYNGTKSTKLVWKSVAG